MLRLMIRQTLSSASLGAARVTPRFPECAAATRTASWEFSSSELLNTFTRGFSASGDSDSSTPSLDEIATDAEAAKTPREVKAEKMGLKYTRGVAEDPWTPTDQLFKRKSYFKRMSHLVQSLEKEEISEREMEKKELPEFRAGDVLAVTLVTPENRRRETVVKGMCIAKRNAGLRSSFTIRNAYGNEGFERRFPTYSPNVKKIEVLERNPVKRAKLYYLRDRAPKEYRVT